MLKMLNHFVFIFMNTLSDFFLNCFLYLFSKIFNFKKLHGWIFRGAGREKKSKLNWIIDTCTWP